MYQKSDNPETSRYILSFLRLSLFLLVFRSIFDSATCFLRIGNHRGIAESFEPILKVACSIFDCFTEPSDYRHTSSRVISLPDELRLPFPASKDTSSRSEFLRRSSSLQTDRPSSSFRSGRFLFRGKKAR